MPGLSLHHQFALLLVIVALTVAPGNSAKKNTHDPGEIAYGNVVPLGVLNYRLLPKRQPFYLMAAAVEPSFNGWRVVGAEYQRRLLNSSGSPVRVYPERLLFRVTANARNPLSSIPFDDLQVSCGTNEYLLKLGFRLAIFHGLERRVLKPAAVRQIGVQSGQLSDVRIYQVAFNLSDVPIEDRLVLEVLGMDGSRIGKFHFDLY